ncbi:cardiolipin synthase [Halotalea alkalilenta]|uniref:Cardiolipin synthase n=1 Tax=Halotalea alkalilenta TaxID=376489 RepID=A0A172YGB1_9GAMM|nr:cardiolipin synthase [Halotalea alkalilenta]ANF58247.1 cardiolipin synthase [Halotalea alkalilenta]
MTAIIGGTLIVIIHVLGVFSAVTALMSSRTSQGAIAWMISLVTFPYVAVPAFWIFGRPRFYGYVSAREERDSELRRVLEGFGKRVEPFLPHLEAHNGRVRAVERLAMMPLTSGNRAELLIDGHASFKSMFDGLARATDYVLIQFFIVRNDRLGQELKRRLIACAERGVRICFIFDEIGSHKLPERYLSELRDAGVEVTPFGSSKGWPHRLQVNFRNHRKVLVVDGREGWVGGLNVGCEYLGEKPSVGAWRDTHLRLEGPSALGLQEAFWEDWYWATNEILALDWRPRAAEGSDQHVVVVPSGPADPLETAGLLIQNAIHTAKRRFWITSPYFVPDQSVQDALKLAALRGVDVRIMIPERPDHLLVYLSAFSFLGEMIQAGVEIHRYQPGFLHQKVMLIDDHTAAVGTVNLDNRSFRLNFEITGYVIDHRFAAEVEAMLAEDFAHCRRVSLGEITHRPLWRKLVSRAAYLASPIQ